MKREHGWWLPDSHTAGLDTCLVHASELGLVLRHMGGRRGQCVQAGGFVGVYPVFLAGWFESVLTFEAEPDNFECLWRNLQARGATRVTPSHAALWSDFGQVGMEPGGAEMGRSRVGGAGTVPAVPLDNWPIYRLDLLMLDVEGSELHALRGAERLIVQHKPVVVIEENGLGEPCEGWLVARGYRAHDRIHKDTVYLPC
jgi:FkbM family methyltransferase